MATKTNSPTSKAKLKIQNVKQKNILLRLFDSDYIWDDKDEVLDAVYWARQVLAFFMGILWGYLGLTGSVSVITFCIANSIGAFAIAKRTDYDFDPEENFSSIKEGFMTTFATFLVTWIISYTAVHFDG